MYILHGAMGLRLLYQLVFLGLLCAGTALAEEARSFGSAGVRIRYVDRGAGPPVVLIHGFTASIETSWIDTGVLPDLARDHRVIALDLRGHGKSDKPRDPRAYDELGMDVIRLLDHLGIERAHVVGYSLGGIVLAKLLTTHPERFLTVVLGGAAYRRSQGEAADLAAESAAQEIEHWGMYRALVTSTAPTDEPPPTDELIRARSQLIVAAGDARAHAALMRSRRAFVVTDAEIAAVRVPTLAVVGSADPAAPRVRAMQQRWPRLEVDVVAGATHPTAHPRGLLRRPEFRQAIRRHIAR